MARTRKSPAALEAPAPAPAPSFLRPWLLQFALPLFAGAALLVAALLLGQHLREALRQRGATTVAFADIDCDPPPGLTREELLGEVQYLANFPDQFDLLDEDVFPRLHRAFAAHPWVESVVRVEQVAPGRVRADLVHRVPVMAVPLGGGARRAVDRHGTLLPAAAAGEALPRFRGTVKPPTGRSGHPWGDAGVEAAARTLGELLPHLDRLGLRPCTVAVADGNVVLRGPRVTVLWGRPPGSEVAGEAAAEVKVRHLLEARGAAGHELDVRPVAGVKRRALP